MHSSHTTSNLRKPDPTGRFRNGWRSLLALLLIASFWGVDVHGQETDFSPFARFGLGTDQGVLTPSLSGMVGVTTVTGNLSAVNADQPASAAGLTNPAFQASIHAQGVRLTEGDRVSNAWTGGPGNFGLVIKQPRARTAFSFGLTPLASKAFAVQRTLEDATLGAIQESYVGTGGMARAYAGLAHGWRGKAWVAAGAVDSVLVSMRGLDVGAHVDHWFGDGIQTSRLDIEDLTFRDVQTVVSSRHRALGTVLGVEGFHVLRAAYGPSKQFEGSWVLRAGATYSPARALHTDYSRVVESTLILNGIHTPIDTAAFEQLELAGTVPAKWTAGGGLQWDGPQGQRVALFVDHHAQHWAEASTSLDHLMDGAGSWGDARRTSVGMTWQRARAAKRLTPPVWRAGFTSATLPVTLDLDNDGTGVPLQEWRGSLGMTLPLQGSRSASQFHLGMDFGQRFTEDPNTHEETTLRLQVGVTLTPYVKNLWLTPRLYD